MCCEDDTLHFYSFIYIVASLSKLGLTVAKPFNFIKIHKFIERKRGGRYIYIYRERERWGEGEGERARETDRHTDRERD